MDEIPFPLDNAPIIEAVLDIDCDLPPNLNRAQLKEAAKDALSADYPRVQEQHFQQHVVEFAAGVPKPPTVTHGIAGLQFFAADGLQLVQFRPNGYSFNRLAPYTSLDDYLPEIERTWRIFVELTRPEQVRKVGLRMINRLPLPLRDGSLDFAEWLEQPPRPPEPEGSDIGILGFLDQQLAVDRGTGQQFNVIKTSQAPENGCLPVILDIDAFHASSQPVPEWAELRERIESLRSLKNRVFRASLTPQCLLLFSRPS